MGNSTIKTIKLSKSDILEMSRNKIIFLYNDRTKVFFYDKDIIIHVDMLIDEYQYNDNMILELYYYDKIIHGFRYVENGHIYSSNKILIM